MANELSALREQRAFHLNLCFGATLAFCLTSNFFTQQLNESNQSEKKENISLYNKTFFFPCPH
jgi:hypothetical protein